MGREGFEHPCKYGLSRSQGGTGGGTPCVQTVTLDAFGRVRGAWSAAYWA